MKASVLDIRKNMKGVLSAIERNEKVTLTYRGKDKAYIVPCEQPAKKFVVKEHPAFGMWGDQGDVEEVDVLVRRLRKGRSFK